MSARPLTVKMVSTQTFSFTPAIFEALEHTCKIHNETTLSAAVRVLSEDKHAKAVQTNGLWIDIDDGKNHKNAEKNTARFVT